MMFTTAENAGIKMSAIEKFMINREIPSMLENIENSGRRIALIVNNMLDFTRKNTVARKAEKREEYYRADNRISCY